MLTGFLLLVLPEFEAGVALLVLASAVCGAVFFAAAGLALALAVLTGATLVAVFFTAGALAVGVFLPEASLETRWAVLLTGISSRHVGHAI